MDSSHPIRRVSFNRERLRALRRERGFSSTDALAAAVRALGEFVSSGHLARLETGAVTRADSDLVVALAEVLRCAPGELLVSRSATAPAPAGAATEGGADVVALAPRGRGRKAPRRTPRALAV